MTLHNLINGLVNLVVFAAPIPLLAWLDRPKARRTEQD